MALARAASAEAAASSREARSAACSTAARRCINNLLLLFLGLGTFQCALGPFPGERRCCGPRGLFDQPPGRKVPAGACAGGSRLTPGGGQVMPRARRLRDARLAAQLQIFGRTSAFVARRRRHSNLVAYVNFFTC